MTCPNLNLEPYLTLNSQFGQGGANLAANLFDSPSFQAWKGDEELPRIEGTTVFNNQGEGFDLTPLFQSRLDYLEQEWEVSGQTFSPAKAQAMVDAFNQSLSGKNYYAHQEDEEVSIDYKKPVLAPNGKPSKLFDSLLENSPSYEYALSLYQQTQSPEFREWFGQSKVVDENGEPLVVYHGSDAFGFDRFDPTKLGERTGAISARRGFFFASNSETSEEYLKIHARNRQTKERALESEELFGSGSEIWEVLEDLKDHEENTTPQQRKIDLILENQQYFTPSTTRTKIKFLEDSLRVGDKAGSYPLPGGFGRSINGEIVSGGSTNNRKEVEGLLADAKSEMYSALYDGDLGDFVYKLFLKAENPLIHNYQGQKKRTATYAKLLDQAKEQGKDGLIILNTFDPTATDIYVVFEPTQIKSVGNRGSFSSQDERIAFSSQPVADQQEESRQEEEPILPPSPLLQGFHSQIEKLTKLIATRMEKFQKENRADMVEKMKIRLTYLSPAIEEATAFAGFVDAYHQDTFGVGEEKDPVTGKVTRKGSKGYLEPLKEWATIIQTEFSKPEGKRDLDKVRQGTAFLDRAGEFVAQVEELESLESLWPNYDPRQFVEKGSPLDQLREVLAAQRQAKSLIQQVRKQAMVAQLGKYLSKPAQAAAQKFLKDKARAEELAALHPQYAKAHLKKARDLQAAFEKNHWNEARMLEELGVNSDDLTTMGRWLESPSTSKNGILSTFYRYLEDLFHQAEVKLQPLSQQAHKELAAFLKGVGKGKLRVEQLMEPLTENITHYSQGGESYTTANLVQETDWNKFNKLQAQAFAHALSVSDDPSDPQYKAILKDFYQTYTQPLTEQERVEIQKEKYRLVEEGSWTNQEYRDWLESNWKTVEGVGEDGQAYTTKFPIKDFQKPKPGMFVNPRYQEVQANPTLKKLYDFLLETRRESQKAYHPSKRDLYRLPSIRKSGQEKVLEGKFSVPSPQELKERVLALFNQDKATDELKYGSKDKTIPTLYMQHMEGSEVSRDLITSILLEAQAAAHYQARKEAKPLAEVLLDTVKDSEIAQKDGAGKQLLDSALKGLGIKSPLTDNKEEKGGKLAAALEDFIDREIYGQTKKEAKIGTFSVDKTLDTLSGLAAKAGIGGFWNSLKALANSTNANISTLLEGMAGKHFTVGEWGQAKGWLLSNYWQNGLAGRDWAAGTPVSLFGQLAWQYGAKPSEANKEFGRHLTKTTGSKLGELAFGNGLQELGETEAQYTMFVTLAQKVTLRGKDGQTSSLLEAYEKGEGGVPALKPNFQGSWSEEEEAALRNKIGGLSLLLQGNYGKLTAPLASRHVVGRVLLMYKKYLEPAVQRRFGQTKVNQQLGDITEGHYRTFFKALLDNYKNLGMLTSLLDGDSSSLTKEERDRVRFALKEMGVVLALTLLAGALKGMGDEEEELRDSGLYQATYYETMKAASELQFFVPVVGIGDNLRVFSSPSAIMTPIKKALDFTGMALNPLSWDDTYEKGSRFHKKGDSKFFAAFQTLVGWNGLSPTRMNAQWELFD